MFYEGSNRIYLGCQAVLLGGVAQGVEIASSEWAAKYIIENQANGYVLGRFVEAERANNNKQYFRLGELLMSQPTITYSPLNINHEVGNIVGSIVASEMQYPADEADNPYVEALGALWKFYFPEAYQKVQRAFAEQALFFSMEAVPRTLSTIGGSDDSVQYAYEGRISPNYPAEINERSCEAIVLNDPHFVGGALILPPKKPGWSHADVKQISNFMTHQWEAAEAMYAGVQDMAPELDPKTWEALMGELILASQEDAGVLSTKARSNLKKSDFAIPEKAPGSGSYPIPDLAHARNALARVAAYGTPEEQSKVRAAVYTKFPELKK